MFAERRLLNATASYCSVAALCVVRLLRAPANARRTSVSQPPAQETIFSHPVCWGAALRPATLLRWRTVLGRRAAYRGARSRKRVGCSWVQGASLEEGDHGFKGLPALADSRDSRDSRELCAPPHPLP